MIDKVEEIDHNNATTSLSKKEKHLQHDTDYTHSLSISRPFDIYIYIHTRVRLNSCILASPRIHAESVKRSSTHLQAHIWFHDRFTIGAYLNVTPSIYYWHVCVCVCVWGSTHMIVPAVSIHMETAIIVIIIIIGLAIRWQIIGANDNFRRLWCVCMHTRSMLAIGLDYIA